MASITGSQLSDQLEQVLVLQKEYNSERTLAMDKRGLMIRRDIPSLLKDMLRGPLQEKSLHDFSWDVEGRDATGKKARIPWVRVFDKRFSQRATFGWYLVYLFDGIGQTVFLTLMRGATENTGDQFVPRDSEWLQTQGDKARLTLFRAGLGFPNHVHTIDLKAPETELAKAYADAAVIAKSYEKGQIPNDQELINDLLTLLEGLVVIYRVGQVI